LDNWPTWLSLLTGKIVAFRCWKIKTLTSKINFYGIEKFLYNCKKYITEYIHGYF
jgi:hypothetical protein